MEKKKVILKDRPSYPLPRRVDPPDTFKGGVLRKGLILKFFGFLFLFILIFLPGYSKFQELLQKNKLLEEKMQKLELSNRRLQDEIKRLEKDPTYMEKIAREKLKVIKKGEVIYKVVETEK